jgi:hypothetical protein
MVYRVDFTEDSREALVLSLGYELCGPSKSSEEMETAIQTQVRAQKRARTWGTEQSDTNLASWVSRAALTV